MYKKYIKVLVILPFLFLHIACGYEPLMTEKYQKYTIKNFNISGDKKLGQILSNKFSKLEKGEHTISLSINAQKNREIANRSNAGSALEYKINITFDVIAVSDSDLDEILNKTYSEEISYKASKLHIDTLNREKKIIDNIIKNINEQITTDLILIHS